MSVDHVFSEKDKIALAVKERLQDTMDQFGYTILQSLVNDIQPAAKVKEAMNEVNASARLKEAAKNEAEAQKIRVIAAAEAEARAKELQGVGIARQRLAIANGLKESVAACSEAGISPEEATKMVLLTQHYDTVTAVGSHNKATVMLMPYGPNGMSQVAEQITAALLTTNEVEQQTRRPRRRMRRQGSSDRLWPACYRNRGGAKEHRGRRDRPGTWSGSLSSASFRQLPCVRQARTLHGQVFASNCVPLRLRGRIDVSDAPASAVNP